MDNQFFEHLPKKEDAMVLGLVMDVEEDSQNATEEADLVEETKADEGGRLGKSALFN